MKYKTTLTLLLITISLFSQDKLLFDELYEFQDDKIKIYLDGVYKVVYKQCADYYMICEINNQLEFTDSVHVYDLKDRIVAKGFFQSSRLNENYTSYFQNGQIESTGKYNDGVRIGIWKYYYNNGQLKKVIDFREGKYFPILISFYKKNGKQKVIDGSGKFKDYITTSISGTYKTKYTGKVHNGLLHGVWKVEVNGAVSSKETFDNGKLIEGISFSVMLGNQKYSDKPVSTIFGLNYLEHVMIWGPSVCNGLKSATLGLSNTFFDELYEILMRNKDDFQTSWYFLEIQTDDNGVFRDAIIFPKNELLNSSIKYGLKDKELETIWLQPRSGSQVILIYLKDDIYFSKTEKIDNYILNFRY